MSSRPLFRRPLCLIFGVALLALSPFASALAQEPGAEPAPDAMATAPPAPDALPASEHEETKKLMETVMAAMEVVEAEGVEAACAMFKEEGSRWYPAADDYVFINDLAGKSLCHPSKPGLEGQSILGLRDPHGKPIVESFLRETEDDGEGWVHYLWPKPPSTTFYWKTSYVRRAGNGDSGDEVIVGSGAYGLPMERLFVVEQVNDAVALIRAEGDAAFPTLRDKASGFRFYDSYVFVMDASGVHLVNAGFPEHEGQNMLSFTDTHGKQVGAAMLELLAQQDAGWVHYMWPRPGDDPASKKSSYVRRVDLPTGGILVVGAGIYTD